ncbi:MAG: amidase family protein, partial [Gammaproteobacteria bacterium]
MSEPWQLSAVDQAAMIGSGQLSATDLVNAVLARIEAADGDINAVVASNPDAARLAAEKADAAVTAGKELGPLHGVPVTIQVNADV